MNQQINKIDFFPESLRETAFSFQKSRIFLSAYELDVFTAIGKGAKTIEEIVQKTATPLKSTERLLNALSALGFLKKDKGKFLNTPEGFRFLSRQSPDFLAGLMHYVHLWDAWSLLTATVRQGRATQKVRRKDPGPPQAFIAAMHDISAQRAKAIVSWLKLSGQERVLDIGAGSGAYSLAFFRAKQGIKVVAFDLPEVISLTQGYIKREGLGDKIETRAGNYNFNDFGQGFDLIFISAVIHINSFQQNLSLIKRCSQALNPGGRLVIQDFIMDPDRVNPVFGALFSLNMLVATDCGDTYTEDEVKTWMKQAGLKDILRKDTQFGTTLIIGKKPQVYKSS